MRASWRMGLFVAALSVASAGCGGAEPPAGPIAEEEEAAADPATLEARRVAIREEVKALIGDLAEAGRYDCCVEAPCNLCAMRAGGCKCGEGLRKGEPVCEECAMMWRRGNGAEPGVQASSVRSYLEAEREMEARAKAGPGEGAPAEAPGCACAEHAPKQGGAR